MPFTNEEAYDMLACYFQSFENAVLASREYAMRYPHRVHHSRMVFQRLARRLRQQGRVQPVSSLRRPRHARTEDTITNVLAYVHAECHISIREIVRDLGVSYGTIQRILADKKLHPYHVVLHQALSEADFDNRLNYCYWLKNMIRDIPQFLSQILWTDEASFTNTGRVNLHNMHYWSETNPHWMREVDNQHRWTVNVWCGIVNGMIVGPHIFEGSLTGEMYVNFLRFDLPGLLENVPLLVRRNLWLQHDGCPAHYSLVVRNFLNEYFPDRWIGRGSLFPWPARSPDLTCLDFYLWGRVKDIVYKVQPTTRADMIIRIRNALNSLPRAEVEAAVISTRRRVHRCILNDGKQFEHL